MFVDPDEAGEDELPEWAKDPRQLRNEPSTGALADGTSQPQQYQLETLQSGRVRFVKSPELFTRFDAELEE